MQQDSDSIDGDLEPPESTDRRTFLKLAVAGTGLAVGGSFVPSAPLAVEAATVQAVKDILVKTGLTLDPETIAYNTDIEEGDVRLAIRAMMHGRGMAVGEGMVVTWADDYQKFYRIEGAQVEA